jgi:CobQ-like glutamine amidotransferase family enzyme
VLPANPSFADALLKLAVERALGEPFVPGQINDDIANEARTRQVRRLAG